MNEVVRPSEDDFSHSADCPVDGKPPKKICTCGAEERARKDPPTTSEKRYAEALTSKECSHFQCVGPGQFITGTAKVGPWNCPWCEVEDLRQFKEWAEPQCQDYAANRNEIDRLTSVVTSLQNECERLMSELDQRRPGNETSEQQPAVVPETLVAWVDERHWRCRCKPPGDITIASASFCRACGTARPELKASDAPKPTCLHDPYHANNTLIVESHWGAGSRIRCIACGGCASIGKKGAVVPETCDCHRAAEIEGEVRG